MVEQRLLVHRVLHLWDFLQVAQLKAFSLEMNAYTAMRAQDWLKLKIQSLSLRTKLQQISFLAQSEKKEGNREHRGHMYIQLAGDYQKPHSVSNLSDCSAYHSQLKQKNKNPEHTMKDIIPTGCPLFFCQF